MDTKTAIVTGASSGIGLALARALLDRGYAVIGNARTLSRLKEASDALGSPERFVPVDGDIGRPEASLIGVQYRANDDGQRQGFFTVQGVANAPWLWDATGLAEGSTFGQFVGGYGIEIDSTAPSSPPGTIVLAQIPDLFGAGISAQMSYYETPAGAKVFAAGALDFGGSATFWPVKRMLDNLWARLSQP